MSIIVLFNILIPFIIAASQKQMYLATFCVFFIFKIVHIILYLSANFEAKLTSPNHPAHTSGYNPNHSINIMAFDLQALITCITLCDSRWMVGLIRYTIGMQTLCVDRNPQTILRESASIHNGNHVCVCGIDCIPMNVHCYIATHGNVTEQDATHYNGLLNW